MAKLLSKEEEEKIINAIKQAEKETSGEIRVHICSHVKGDVTDAAKKIFEKLGMHATRLKNGVLIFVALNDRKFAVIGDTGIDKAVPENFWNKTVAEMAEKFAAGKTADAICTGILTAGEQLKTYFPYTSDDVNELSDEVSYDDSE